MKAFYLFFALSLIMASCNSYDAETAETPIPPAALQANDQPQPATKASPANSSKPPKVEKTQRVPEAPVADAGVNYQNLAASACKCGEKLFGTEGSHVGQVHVDANSTEFQAEVDCFMAAKNKMTKEKISRQKLITQIKNSCPDIPGKLVTRIMLTLGK